MATITVTTLEDVVGNDGQVSLREAIAAANSDLAGNDAPAGSGHDTINFAAGLRGTVALTEGRLELTQGVTITGDTNFDAATPDITIDGSGNDESSSYTAGVFSVTNNAQVWFGSLVITGGDAGSNGGGGIHSDAGTSVTIISSVITGNSVDSSTGGGLWARGSLTIYNSTISDNHGEYFGGGIAAYGDLKIVGSVISGNDGYVGGGVWFGVHPTGGTEGKLTIVNSTIAENTSGNNGGGLFIGDTTSTATLINTTVSSNHASAGGGIYTKHHDLKIYNSTIAHNTVVPSLYVPTPIGAGIAAGNFFGAPSTHLYNTVVAANNGAADIGVKTGNANTFTGRYGTIGDAGGLLQDGVSGVRVGTEDAPIDPMLAPLALNLAGTFTHAILPGSPLINQGNASNPLWMPDDPYNPGHDITYDGIFYPRVWGSGLDLGAVEFQNQWTVTSTSDSDDDGIGASALADILDGEGLTLREALIWAESGATITFAESLSGQTINLNSKLVLSKDVYIDGDLDNDHLADVTIDGQSTYRLFDVNAGVNAALVGLKFYDGNDIGANGNIFGYNGAAAGSAVMNLGTLTIADSVFGGNVATGGDGYRFGPYVDGGNGGGAATIVNQGQLAVTNSSFGVNRATGGYGASGGHSFIATVPGGSGGAGGHAAAGILQLSTAPNSLIIDNVRFYDSYATGGTGGEGGHGGSAFDEVSPPGDGGNGGAGGNAGFIVVGAGSNVSGNLQFETNDTHFTAGLGGFGGNPGAAWPTGPIGNTGFVGAPGVSGVLVLVGGATDAVSHLVTNSNDSGAGSLRYAIEHAHEGDTIRFSKEMSSASISLLTELTISQDLTIVGDVDGDDKADITLSGRDLNRIFNISGTISNDTVVKLGSLTLVDGSAAGSNGGAILTDANSQLSLLHATVTSSTASKGGGIYAGGRLSMVNTTIDHNAATNFGGGIYVASSQYTVGVNATIAYNMAGSIGGGIDTGSGSEILLINSTIIRNTAGFGGGIDLFTNSTATLWNSILNENTGGDLYKYSDTTFTASHSILGTGVVENSSDPSNIQSNDANLGELLDNGGTVRTISPLDGSAAIDAGDNALRGFDVFDLDHDGLTSPPQPTELQELTPLDGRMQPRILGSRVDIGAVEWTIDERIVGAAGGDVIYGGVGRDTLKGGGGHDTLYGGEGIDTADFSDKSSQVAINLAYDIDGSVPALVGGFEEFDQLHSIENLIGGAAGDNLAGDGLDNIFMGGLGDDRLTGGLGIDTADYSDKAQSVYVDLVNNVAQIGSETDGLYSIENIIGGSAGDSLNGDDNVVGNKLEGRGGNDTLSGGAGNDTLDGGAGFDVAEYRHEETPDLAVVLSAFGNATVNAGSLGIDTLISIEGVEGGHGADRFTGNASDNYFYGSAGNDTFKGGLGDDTMDGGGHWDTVDYSERKTKVTVALDVNGDATVVLPGGETDTLESIENIIGGSGGDALTGNATANKLVGNRGDDTFRGGGGQDIIDGGAGSDTADFSDHVAQPIKITLSGATPASVFVTTGLFFEDTLANVENLIGSDKVDTFTGDSFANTFKGLAGKDVFDGKTGSDTADYSDKTLKVTVTLKTTTAVDVFVGGTATANKEDKIKNFENLIGGSNNDKFTGDKLANIFKGLAGNDTLDGSTGSDTADYSEKTSKVEVTLKTSTSVKVKIGTVNEDSIKNIENIWGGSAGDKLTGDSAANTFRGFAGADTLNGGLGKDTLTGGKDADVFVFNSTLSSSNVDTITDFKPGTDKIQFDDKVFKGLGTTFDFAEFYAAAGAVKGHDLDDRLIFNTTTGKLYYDVDGNKSGGKAAILVATIMDGTAPANLQYSDLQMI